MKYDFICIPYLLGIMAIVEGTLNLFFFFESPFMGYLIPISFQNLFLTQIFRSFLSIFFVPWLAMKVSLEAVTVAGYIFILGPFSFASYLEKVNSAKMKLHCRQFYPLVLTYNQVSLLVTLFNSLFSNRMFIRVIFPSLGIPELCFCTAFLMNNVLGFSMVTLLSVVGLVVLITVLLLLTFCANVRMESKAFLHSIDSLADFQRSQYSYRKRLICSMFPTRIKLGESNFVEMSTPLVVMSLCIQQTVNILCLKNGTN